MNWDLAIERHRGPLLEIVTDLFEEIGLSEGGMIEKLARPVYRKVLRTLRKAESAVRRLIFVAARDIVLESPARRPAREEPKISTENKGKADDEGRAKSGDDDAGQWLAERIRKGRMRFRLFDPPQRFDQGSRPPTRRLPARSSLQVVNVGSNPMFPIYLVFRVREPRPAPGGEAKADDGMVNSLRVCRRLFALKAALENLQAQAMRLAQWQAKPIEERRPDRWSPLRAGRAPGLCRRARDELDEILKECDWLARNVMPALDTS